MKTTLNPPVDASEAQAEAPVVAVEQVSNGANYINTIKQLLASGAKRISSIRVKNVNATEKDNYTMIGLTLASKIRGFVASEDGVSYEAGTTNTMFTSLYAVAGAMKEDSDLGWMANTLLERPQALNLILNGATIDVVQQEVKAGEEYKNPFSTKDEQEAQVFDHDVIINNIIGFKLGESGKKMADRLADKLLGF